MRPAYLSATQLNTFLACPAKYRFRYVDRIEAPFRSSALALGSAVHSAVEWLHKRWRDDDRPSEAQVVRIFEADLAAQAVDEIRFRNGESLADLRETGRSLIRTYFAGTDARAPRAMELPFEVELVHPVTGEVLDVPLQGWFDLIEADGTLVELKTAARLPDATTLALHVQLSAYSYAARLIYRKRPALRMDCLLKGKRIRLERIQIERNEDDDRRLFVLAQHVLAAVEAESFFPNPSWMCRNCEFRHLCPVWNI